MSLIVTEIKNPIAPIINKPIAVTFEISLNSCRVGFLSNLQTLRY